MRIAQLDLFAKKENVETYQQVLQHVRDVLAEHQQENLLESIISQPLKSKNNKDLSDVNITVDDSAFLYKENSSRLSQDLEALLPLIGKCLVLLLLDKSALDDQSRKLKNEITELQSMRKYEQQNYL